MKKSYFLLGLMLPGLLMSQSFVSLATDPAGDDYPSNPDATQLLYAFSANGDSLYLKLVHQNDRSGDFGYAFALDTNLITTDGSAVNQTNLKSGTPNTSLQYDLVLYLYQNIFFPGLNVDALDANGNPWAANFSIDTTDSKALVLGIPISDLNGKKEFNVLGFTGTFDIGPGGAGPSDVIPNTGFGQIREQGVGLEEQSLVAALFPNPCQGILYLAYEGEVSLWNLQGQKVKSLYAHRGTPLNLSSLPKGHYLLTGENGGVLGKVVLED